MPDDSDDPSSDALVDAVLEEFGGNPRAAIKALLHDIDALARDFSNNVSRGYVRHEKTTWVRMIGGRRMASDE